MLHYAQFKIYKGAWECSVYLLNINMLLFFSLQAPARVTVTHSCNLLCFVTLHNCSEELHFWMVVCISQPVMFPRPSIVGCIYSSVSCKIFFISIYLFNMYLVLLKQLFLCFPLHRIFLLAVPPFCTRSLLSLPHLFSSLLCVLSFGLKK